jgi:hypothetical protein
VLKAMSRRICSAYDIINRFDSRIRYEHADHQDDIAFKEALSRYLLGQGHVMSKMLKDAHLMTDEMHEKACSDPLSCVTKFYRHASGKIIPPSGSIVVRRVAFSLLCFS